MRPEDVFDATTEVPQIDALRDDAHVAARIQRCISTLARCFPHSTGLHTLAQASFEELLGLWADQQVKSRREEAPVALPVPRRFAARGLLHRAHHQLLCSEASLLAKRARIQAGFGRQASILLVGDDDQLAPQLVAAGYTGVSALDIDPDVVASLQRSCGEHARVRVHDITRPPPADWIGHYDLIVMDPPYSVEGIMMFAEGALRFCAPGARPRVQLYCASSCLTRDGIAALRRRLDALGYVLERFEPGVCKYPYPWTTRLLGRVALAVVARLSGASRAGVTAALLPRHVGSDLWELRRRGDAG